MKKEVASTPLEARTMVDRVYKRKLPAQRRALERLREEFSRIDAKTDWAKLRIEPFRRHVQSLMQVMVSREFSAEFSRLTKGVVFFRSDLEYLRKNINGLGEILRSEKASIRRRGRGNGS